MRNTTQGRGFGSALFFCAENVSAVVASLPLHSTAQITYYRTQAQFDKIGRDHGPVGMANANARLIAARLDAMGYDVGWAYPDDPGNVYHG